MNISDHSNGNNVTTISLPSHFNVLSTIWMVFVFFIGLIVNGFILTVYAKNKHLITPFTINIICMVFNNIGMCCFGVGMTLVVKVRLLYHNEVNMDLCVAEAFSTYLCGLANLFIQVSIAVSRFFIVTKKTKQFGKQTSVILVCSCESVAFMFAVAPLSGWGAYGLTADGATCDLTWRGKDSAISYLISVTIMGFVIPMAVIVFCHIMIYRTVIASRRLAQSGSYDQRLHHKKETKLFKLSIVIVAAFLTAWTPYAVVSFYEAFGKPKNLNPLLSLSAALFAKSGVIWSCVINISVMDEFRKQATAMVTCIRQKREQVVTCRAQICLLRSINTEEEN